ncbi:hypothetical protein M409DRAFT_63401 [Zasmidium cellare ATCC 36951]|uniref:DUF4267 domain-containing protein n=1 Tax=Zasmidium cellare ATCC 36951 TaxID=1080233 RepID=A0A6A6CXT1_ZASCE|nr:uncharacterized protein M409DRAFT_63401 [Zasmidium cellare ATCC 36951]KAF2171845.1 hypothetical protein M409DRAFT_63401 [Zasmidium cellare ATCC 36951]
MSTTRLPSLTNTTLFSNLPPPSECLAILLGLAELTAFGLTGLTDPTTFSTNHGLPIQTTQQPQQHTSETTTKRALVQAIAARNVQNGALLLTLALYTRDRTALGIAVGLGVVTTLADTLIVRANGVKDTVAFHAVGIVNSVLLGGSLLWWGREDRFFK